MTARRLPMMGENTATPAGGAAEISRRRALESDGQDRDRSEMGDRDTTETAAAGKSGASGKALTLDEMKAFALSRGGQCLSEGALGPAAKHRWRCAQGHEFEASPRLLIDAGYWCPDCFPTIDTPSRWDWETLAQNDPLLKRFCR